MIKLSVIERIICICLTFCDMTLLIHNSFYKGIVSFMEVSFSSEHFCIVKITFANHLNHTK